MNANLRNVVNHPKRLVYDYQELIGRLKNDIKQFDLNDDDNIYILRSSIKRYNYQPIHEYYLADDIRLINPKMGIEKMILSELLEELYYLNGDNKEDKARLRKNKVKLSKY